jgi:hypothetical protein
MLWLLFPPGKELRCVWAEVTSVTDLNVLEKGKIYCFYRVLNLGPSCAQSRDSSFGIVTGYGLDGPRIESFWGARFCTPV